MLRLRLKQLMARPGDVSGTMLRSAGLATAMLPVAASHWPLMSQVTILEIPADESAVTADGDAAVIPSKKRRRSGGPARAAREAAFLASKACAATDNP